MSGVPSGWTLIGSTTNDASLLLLSYWKIAGGSEPSSYEWLISGSLTAEGGITRYTGVNTSNPIDDVAGNSGLSTTATTSVITTTGASTTIVALFAVDEGKTGTAGSYFGPVTGMTERYDVSNTAVAAVGPSIALDDASQAAAGTVASKSSAIGGNNKAKNWASQVIALRNSGVAFDSATNGFMSGSNTATYTLTFTNSGGDFVAVSLEQAKPVSDDVASMDYGGATCSVVESVAGFTANNDRTLSLWVCPNAPTGTHDLSVTYDTSTVEGGFASISSYSGASNVQPDTHNSNYTTSGASTYSATLTSSSTAGDWMITAFDFQGTANTLSAGSGTVVRSASTNEALAFTDSGGPIGTAGSSWTTNASGTSGTSGIVQMSMMISPQ